MASRNRWMEGLHYYNQGSDEWCIPRKGTDRYNDIMGRIRRPVSKPVAQAAVPSAGRKSRGVGRRPRIHRSHSPRHPHGGRRHRSSSPRHPMRTTYHKPERKARQAVLPSQPKNPLVYNKETGVYAKATGVGLHSHPHIHPHMGHGGGGGGRGGGGGGRGRGRPRADSMLILERADSPTLALSRADSLTLGLSRAETMALEMDVFPEIAPRTLRLDETQEFVDLEAPPPRDVVPYISEDQVHRVIPIDLTDPHMSLLIPDRNTFIRRASARLIPEVQDDPVIQREISGRTVSLRPLLPSAPEQDDNVIERLPVFRLDEEPNIAPVNWYAMVEEQARGVLSDAIRNRKARELLYQLRADRHQQNLAVMDVNEVRLERRRPSGVEAAIFETKKKQK